MYIVLYIMLATCVDVAIMIEPDWKINGPVIGQIIVHLSEWVLDKFVHHPDVLQLPCLLQIYSDYI